MIGVIFNILRKKATFAASGLASVLWTDEDLDSMVRRKGSTKCRDRNRPTHRSSGQRPSASTALLPRSPFRRYPERSASPTRACGTGSSRPKSMRRARGAYDRRARGVEEASQGGEDPPLREGVPEKSGRLLRQGGWDTVSCFRLIEAQRANYSVPLMCRLLSSSELITEPRFTVAHQKR